MKQDLIVVYTERGKTDKFLPVPGNIEDQMKTLAKSYAGIKGAYIQYEVFNSVSDTYICLSSFYINENRYVKH